MSAGILLLALLLDYCIGWPDQLFQRIGHPVTWLGRLINVLEQRFNARSETTRFAGRCFGLLTLFIVALLSGGIGWWLQQFFAESSWFWLIGAVAAWPWIAMRSMKEHVEAVAAPLTHQQLPEARYAVSMIVGRNPDNLDETGVARAALESLAENTSDGVIAPLFWALLCGLPGLFLYKSVNTLDSMIGHRNDRYEHFGWASARFDDLLNLIPARLTGLLFTLQAPWWSKPVLPVLEAMRAEAPQHRSPNAGWPESALAQVLGVSLAGPRQYDAAVVEAPFINPQGRAPGAQDLQHGLMSYRWLIYTVVGLLAITALLQSF